MTSYSPPFDEVSAAPPLSSRQVAAEAAQQPAHTGVAAVVGLVVWLAVTFGASALGALGAGDAKAFYQQLLQPPWAPPATWFGPVWTVLYALMGIAAWMVWREGRRHQVGPALSLYVAQLALNALWTWLFFEWRSGGWALVEIVALLSALGWTTLMFWRVRPRAAALMLPAVAWVMFATVLNAVLLQRNPALLG